MNSRRGWGKPNASALDVQLDLGEFPKSANKARNFASCHDLLFCVALSSEVRMEGAGGDGR